MVRVKCEHVTFVFHSVIAHLYHITVMKWTCVAFSVALALFVYSLLSSSKLKCFKGGSTTRLIRWSFMGASHLQLLWLSARLIKGSWKVSSLLIGNNRASSQRQAHAWSRNWVLQLRCKKRGARRLAGKTTAEKKDIWFQQVSYLHGEFIHPPIDAHAGETAIIQVHHWAR